jgi:hypothetical protein
MASDSDPRLKRRRGGRLSNQQVAAFAALGVVILLATAAYYSEVLWEIEHVRKAHAYVSDKAAAANTYAYQVGTQIQSTQTMKSLNEAAYNVGSSVAPAMQKVASGFTAMSDAWFGESYYYDDYYLGDYYAGESYQNWWDDELADDFEDEWSWDEDFWNDYAATYFGDYQDYFWKEANAVRFDDFQLDYLMPYDDWDYLSYFDADTGLAPGVTPQSIATAGSEWKFDDDEFEMVLGEEEFWPDFYDPDDLDDFFDWSHDWQLGKEQSNFQDLARLDNDIYFNDFSDDAYDYELLFWGEETPDLDAGTGTGGGAEQADDEWRRHRHRRNLRSLAELIRHEEKQRVLEGARRTAGRKVMGHL